jgi:hypothetical protein
VAAMMAADAALSIRDRRKPAAPTALLSLAP